MQHTEESKQPELHVGDRCLITVMGRHFMVKIRAIADTELQVSFPGIGYPIEGTPVEIELHDDSGFYNFQTEVVKGPRAADEPVVLRRPAAPTRHHHRRFFRVPTDLTAQVKDQVRVRRYDAGLIDLGLGGCLVSTEAAFEFGGTVELTLSLPGEPVHTVLGQVVHVAESTDRKTRGVHLYGLRFIGLDPDVERSVGEYIWQRLRDLYPPR